MKSANEELLLRIASYYAKGMSVSAIAARLEVKPKEVERSLNLIASNYSLTYLEADQKRNLLQA